MHWHAHYDSTGTGHLCQGRFKSFPFQESDHLYSLNRYVERNAQRAGLVQRAEDWEWGRLWDRVYGDGGVRLLSPWPVPIPEDWVSLVNEAHTEAELRALRRSVKRGQPYGDLGWVAETARRMGLEETLRPLGGPRKREKKASEEEA